MLFKNVYIKVLSNNIFIVISEKNNKVIKVESMGSVGFKHKEKKILEGFKILINQLTSYFENNYWKINTLKISGALRFKLKLIKAFVYKLYFVRLCKIIEKNSYNGCRLKKKKRKKRKQKIKIYKKF